MKRLAVHADVDEETLAKVLKWVDQVVADSIAGIGGVLLVGVGINLLGLKQIPVGNYILSLFIPFLITF